MALAVGSYCPVCKQVMGEEEDLGVCPLCGATYHRACYQEQGACLFEELHQKGEEYQPEYPKKVAEQATPPEESICPRCGVPMLPGVGAFCPSCGTMLHLPKEGEDDRPVYEPLPPDPYMSPLGGLEAGADLGGGHKASEFMTFVHQNTPYYLLRFDRFSKKLPLVDFNFSAILLGPVYFLYRKMYVWAGLLMLTFFLGSLPTLLDTFHYLIHGEEFFQNADLYHNLSMIGYLFSYAMRFLFGILANRLYYRHCIRRMNKLRADCPENLPPQYYGARLAAKGGVSTKAVVITLLVLFAVSFVIMSLLMGIYPQMIDHYMNLISTGI